ncbi:MAG: 30S ribosomal protein S15 [Candidatus Nealsonbacteria bacterium]
MLKTETKTKLITKYKLHESDTGSPEVQVALLSDEVKKLLLHLKKNPKDVHSKRGLLKMISKRKSLLNFLKKEDTRRYNRLIKKVGLRK